MARFSTFYSFLHPVEAFFVLFLWSASIRPILSSNSSFWSLPTESHRLKSATSNKLFTWQLQISFVANADRIVVVSLFPIIILSPWASIIFHSTNNPVRNREAFAFPFDTYGTWKCVKPSPNTPGSHLPSLEKGWTGGFTSVRSVVHLSWTRAMGFVLYIQKINGQQQPHLNLFRW